jgi:hypothetical protein
MKSKPMVVAVAAAWLGCSEPNPQHLEAIEQLNSLTFTSMTFPSLAERVEEQRESVEPELASMDGLTIKRFVTTAEIDNHEPVAISSVFADHGETVYAFVEVSNESKEEKVLLVNFLMPEGEGSSGIELRVPPMARRWRTWAYARNLSKPGNWWVEIRTADQRLIQALPFEVEPGC